VFDEVGEACTTCQEMALWPQCKEDNPPVMIRRSFRARQVSAMDSITFAAAHKLALAIQNREVSSVEVVNAHLAQI
jgi:hypothetical protein